MESPSGTNRNGSEGGGLTNQTTTALITIPPGSPEVPLSSPARNSQSSGPVVSQNSVNSYRNLIEEATPFSTEIKRLQSELAPAKNKISVQEQADEPIPGTSAAAIAANRQLQRHRLKKPIVIAPVKPHTKIETGEEVKLRRIVGQSDHAQDTARFDKGFFRLRSRGYSSHCSLRTQEAKFKCGICKQRFVLYCLLKRHLKDMHGIDSAFGCRYCRKTFSSHPRLYAHRKIAHSRASIQQQTSYQQVNLSDPEKYDREKPSSSISLAVSDVDEKGESLHGIDTTEIGNVCICGMDFTLRKSLTRHIRRMTEKWNFICTFCKKPCFEKTELHRHMKLAHKVNFSKGNKTFGCARCGDEFKTRSELYRHVEIAHEGKDEQQGDDKPDAELSTSGNFGEYLSNNHRSLSTPRKRWIQHGQQAKHGKDASRAELGHFCLCGTEFKSSTLLYHHTWYNTSKLPCLLCPRHFASRSYLKRHMERAHPPGKK